MTSPPRDVWLSLDEAAALWGVSRLRLREAIAAGALAAQRDNRGFWRVRSDKPVDFAAQRAPPERLVEALFDEIEELGEALGRAHAGGRKAERRRGAAAGFD